MWSIRVGIGCGQLWWDLGCGQLGWGIECSQLGLRIGCGQLEWGIGCDQFRERRGILVASVFWPSDLGSFHVVSLGKILYSLSASSSRIRTLSRRSRLLSSNPVVDVKEPLGTQVRPSSVSVLDRVTGGVLITNLPHVR